MTIYAPHVIVMIMLHTCAGPQVQNLVPAICIYCGSTDHRSGNCPYKPWDNREQPGGTLDALRKQHNQQANNEIS